MGRGGWLRVSVGRVPTLAGGRLDHEQKEEAGVTSVRSLRFF